MRVTGPAGCCVSTCKAAATSRGPDAGARRYTRAMTKPMSLDGIVARTLADYENNAQAFSRGTRDHDVSQNVAALLRPLQGEGPFRILDFGCGPGRDLRAWKELGHVAIGLDGCAAFVAMARRDTGCEVWLQDFLHVDLPHAFFDGVFANAS